MKAGTIKKIILSFAIGLLVIKHFVCDYFIVSGNSMNNSFFNKEVVFVNKIYKYFDRFDVVICDSGELGTRGIIIKRIIGLPYETVQIIDGYVYINNKKLDDVVDVKMDYAGIANEQITLGKDQYFLLGDNRNESEDSRNEWLGIVNKSQIEGKVIFKIIEKQNYSQ